MDTRITRDFAGGQFDFWLPMHMVVAIERGPSAPALRSREYPVSIFQIYDELSAGIGIDQDGNPVFLPGTRLFFGDIHNILERALLGGNSGTKDGGRFDVGPQLAARLLSEYLPLNVEGYALLAWSVLHAAIKGIDLKKKAEPAAPVKRSRSAKAKSSPTVAS